ncbi:GNAT family N-acetyltransferase [Mycolicibacterium baixiangningiae]|uniref:GNAT family N-acetyltransferase n=1 Tax=Mycolicibacterium baixiangningiae TaxID=2761578 RepID=UPI001868A8D0|nr:GNAT family N-acetyltransferase [Mycolicibacterium baixiangningiae]
MTQTPRRSSTDVGVENDADAGISTRTQQFNDNSGARVTVSLDEAQPISAYTVSLTDGSPVGRAEFVDSPEADGERIVFHTEVGEEFRGRGLAGLLVREALTDSIRKNLTIVPLCPLFAAHLKKHGGEFLADGGRFRRPTAADIALVTRVTRSDAAALTHKEGHAVADN